MRTPQDLIDRCDVCQHMQSAPTSFRVSLGSLEARFNQLIYIDIMYIESQPVLHVVDGETPLSAVQLLTNISTQSVLDALVSC